MREDGEMGEGGKRAHERCRAFMEAASEYAEAADLAAIVSATLPIDPDHVETGCWGGPVTREPCESRVLIDFDGGAETKVVGGHMLALGEIADRHGAEVRPMRLEPEHPAEGEPFTMILTYHFTEG